MIAATNSYNFTALHCTNALVVCTISGMVEEECTEKGAKKRVEDDDDDAQRRRSPRRVNYRKARSINEQLKYYQRLTLIAECL